VRNEHGLPAQFERFSEAEAYSRGDSDISVTGLMGPAQIAHLTEKHQDELEEEDVSDNIMAILGTAVHSILEKGAGASDIIEERFSLDVGGTVVSGAIDCLSPSSGVSGAMDIFDWKVTSAATMIYNPEGKKEWFQQLNMYDRLARENGIKVGNLHVICLVRDWTKSKAAYNPKTYPQQSIIDVPIPRWDADEQWSYLRSRLDAHSATVPAPCTPDEQWAKPPTYAVYATTASGTMGKRAKRVLDSESDAVSYMMEHSIVGSIETRPGSLTRCESWCPAAPFCDQYQSTIEKGDYL